MNRIIKESFEKMANKYKNLLTNFYPARESTGFTEANQTHFFINSMREVLDDENFIEWLELPWTNKNEHIDGMIYSPKYKTIFYIESKRFALKDKLYSISNDIKRVISDNKSFLADYNLKDIEKEYVIGLADIWDEEAWKTDLIKTWENPTNQFTEILNIIDYNDTRLKQQILDKYYLLITFNEISEYRKIEENFWDKLQKTIQIKYSVSLNYDYDEEKRYKNANLEIQVNEDLKLFIRRTENSFITIESNENTLNKFIALYKQNWIYTNPKINFYSYNKEFLKLKNTITRQEIIDKIVNQIDEIIAKIS